MSMSDREVRGKIVRALVAVAAAASKARVVLR